MKLTVTKTIFFLFLFMMMKSSQATSNNAAVSSSSSSVTIQLQRPRQFRMSVYSRPYRKGLAQHMRLDNNNSQDTSLPVARPCWNLESKHVGSIEVNDPFVKVIFYRSSDCRGSPSLSIQGSETLPAKKHSMIKAGSVSVTRIRPIVFRQNSYPLF